MKTNKNKNRKTKKTIKIKFANKIIIALIVALIALIAVLLFIFFISYIHCANEQDEEKTIIKQEQETKLPSPPEERYVSGTIESVQEESFIVNLKNGKQEQVFFDEQTEVFKGEGKGIMVSKEEIQTDYHVACFLPKDKNNNTATIIHVTKRIGSK